MQTDGLNAFDEDTRQALSMLLRDTERKQARNAREPRVRKPPRVRTPRQPSPVTLAAIEWEDHRAAMGRKPAEFFAKKHGADLRLMYSAAHRVRARREWNRTDRFSVGVNAPTP